MGWHRLNVTAQCLHMGYNAGHPQYALSSDMSTGPVSHRWLSCLLLLVWCALHPCCAQAASPLEQRILSPVALLQSATTSNGRLTVTIQNSILLRGLFPRSTQLPDTLDIIGAAEEGRRHLPELDLSVIGVRSPAFSLPVGEYSQFGRV